MTYDEIITELVRRIYFHAWYATFGYDSGTSNEAAALRECEAQKEGK